MAVAAEQQTQELIYQLADDIPQLEHARRVERVEAHNVLNQRRLHHQHGTEAQNLPLQIDALSTANAVLAAERIYGQNSPEHEELLKGLRLDSLRLLAEWYRKLKPEYFPKIRHTFKEDTEEFFSDGLSVSKMTFNALTPIPENPEEESRRINERVEDATPRHLRKIGGLALDRTVIRTISECSDKALTDYAADVQSKSKHRGYGGYVPEVAKMMIRDISLDTLSNDRFQEQVALPGLYITHEIVQMALERRGINASHMDKTELHGSQIIATDNQMEFVELLDEIASEQWCVEIFAGEVVAKGTVKDYAAFKSESIERQEGLKDHAQVVASFVLDLARDQVDGIKAPQLVEDFVKLLLLEMGKNNFEAAASMFGEDIAVDLRRVVRLEQAGLYQEAFDLMQEVEKAAPGGGYCGAGCGIESVDKYSKEGNELAKNLKAEAGDTIVKDKERACKCGQKTVTYAYNKTKVNKFCTSCKSFESKRTTGRGVK